MPRRILVQSLSRWGLLLINLLFVRHFGLGTFMGVAALILAMRLRH